MENALALLIQSAPFGGFTILYLIVMTRYFQKQQKEIKEMYSKCIDEIKEAYYNVSNMNNK